MSDHIPLRLSDVEIIEKVHGDQESAAALGKERFGDLADAIDVLRYRLSEWWEKRSKIRPIHNMTRLYREDPALARELAVLSCARSALTSMMNVAGLLRSGMILSIPAVSRAAHELFIDATFLRLDASGKSAIRMLDWQLSDTARINSDDLGLQADLEKMKEEYKDDKNFGRWGTWAELPNDKKYHSFDSRMQYVYAAMEKEVPDYVLSEEDWPFLKQMTRNQRARANATVHASPIAAATVDDQIFMAVQAALHASQTVAAYRRVSDEWMDENFADVLSELGPLPLIEDEAAWRLSGTTADQLILVIRQTFGSSATEHGTLQDDGPVAASAATDLVAALRELAEAPADAVEDDLEVPTEMAMSNAERLLKAMYLISPRRYGVYPVSGARIAIDARGLNDRGMVVTCDSDGGALCLVSINGERRRAWYSTARQLPDGFIREALADLDVKPPR